METNSAVARTWIRRGFAGLALGCWLVVGGDQSFVAGGNAAESTPSVRAAKDKVLDVGSMSNKDVERALRVVCKSFPVGRKTAVLVAVVNVGENAVRIFVPGLVGPEFYPCGREGVPWSLPGSRRLPSDRNDDFAVLRPSESFARYNELDRPYEEFMTKICPGGTFTVYETGREGRQDSIRGALSESTTVWNSER